MSSAIDSRIEPLQVKRQRGLRWIFVLVAVFHFATSWRLWVPQTVFPQVPLLAGFVWPDLLAWCGLGLVFASLVGMALCDFTKVSPVWCECLFLASVGALLLEDQHRFQPWVVHYLWVIFLFVVSPPKYTLRLILVLTGSIYFYSAMSKFNGMFFEQHGYVILSGLFKSLSLELKRVPEELQSAIIFCFPLGELAIAIGLFWRKTRRLFAILAVLMHAVLIWVFSSRGLNHGWSVLLWNFFFLIQAVWLWVLIPKHEPGNSTMSWRAVVCLILAFVIWFLPVLRFSGHLDQWLGWSLYSPRAEAVRILLSEPPEQIGKGFPHYTQKPFEHVQFEAGPVFFLPDRWSLAVLDVPLNPESRLELAVAKSLSEKYDCWDDLAVVHELRDLSEANSRQTVEYIGRQQIESFSQRYLLPTICNRRFLNP